jgi:hypothetical protein
VGSVKGAAWGPVLNRKLGILEHQGRQIRKEGFKIRQRDFGVSRMTSLYAHIQAVFEPLTLI